MTPPFLQLNNAVAVENLFDLLGIKDPGLRLDIIPSVLPVAILDQTNPVLEDRLAIGEEQTLGGAAGEFPHVQIFNPAPSGVDVHVDSAIIHAGASGDVELRIFDTALTTNSVNKAFRDRRLAGSPVAQVRGENANPTLGAPIIARVREITNENILFPIDGFLGPGQGFLFLLANATQSLTVTWFWEETPRRRTG